MNITPGHIQPSDILSLVGKADPTIVEVGCNDGTDTLTFLSLFPRVTMHCFEPDPRAAERFLRNVSDARVKLYLTAVGNHNGTIDFYPSEGLPRPLPKAEAEQLAARLPKGWDLSGSIRKPKDHLRMHPWCQFGEPVQVPIVKLDDWAMNHCFDIVDFMWADVQGAEVDLINGGHWLLEGTRYLYTEYSNREMYEGQIGLETLLKMLPDFEVVKLYSEDVLLRNTKIPAGA